MHNLIIIIIIIKKKLSNPWVQLDPHELGTTTKMGYGDETFRHHMSLFRH